MVTKVNVNTPIKGAVLGCKKLANETHFINVILSDTKTDIKTQLKSLSSVISEWTFNVVVLIGYKK